MIAVTNNPKPATWPALLARPQASQPQVQATVAAILEQIKAGGDAAVASLNARFGDYAGPSLKLEPDAWQNDIEGLSSKLKTAIDTAAHNITTFHAAQLEQPAPIETSPGVVCWRRSTPIDRVGLYIPGGSAPLFSTLLMLGLPARLAGCPEIVVCTPSGPEGNLHPAILYAAKLAGVTELYRAGGAQGIAALAFGTETLRPVYKIFGPGNAYVTEAKQQIQQNGVAIDMPAGPSELAILADSTCHPAFVAADLLSQAEHGPDSQVVLVSTSESVLKAIVQEVDKQLIELPRQGIARQALGHSKAILVESPEAAIELLNYYAPEHLILAVENPDELATQVRNAGSVFLGHYSPESAGDYASGTNHTLPTNGWARVYGGVSVDSFVKKITYQKISYAGLQTLGPAIIAMAQAEGLYAHSNAVSIRLNS
jgi:histidinol dehydrogenase